MMFKITFVLFLSTNNCEDLFSRKAEMKNKKPEVLEMRENKVKPLCHSFTSFYIYPKMKWKVKQAERDKLQ